MPNRMSWDELYPVVVQPVHIEAEKDDINLHIWWLVR